MFTLENLKDSLHPIENCIKLRNEDAFGLARENLSLHIRRCISVACWHMEVINTFLMKAKNSLRRIHVENNNT